MIRRPPRSTRTDTLFPYTTLFRSNVLPTGKYVCCRRFSRISKKVNCWKGNFARPSFGPSGLWLRLNPLVRSEEHTSELQSLMRISYAVFCLKQTKIKSIRPYSTLSYELPKSDTTCNINKLII